MAAISVQDSPVFSGDINSPNNLLQGTFSGAINFIGGDNLAKQLDACVAALGQTDPSYHRERLLASHDQVAKDTWQWILNEALFQQWASEGESDRPLFWVCDDKQMGKTPLAIFLSEHLEGLQLNNQDCCVLYHFCDEQHENSSTASSILKSLLYQYYKKYRSLAQILLEEYKLSGDRLLQDHMVEDLWGIFKQSVDAGPVRRIYCVIDGVNQCQEETLGRFLKALNRYFTTDSERRNSAKLATVVDEKQNGSSPCPAPKKTPQLRMVILTRDSPKCVPQQLKAFPHLSIKNGCFESGESVWKRYVDAHAENVTQKYSGKKEPSQETTQLVTETLNRSKEFDFVWVGLVADRMMEMTSNQLKKFVKEVPDTVEKVYSQALLRIPSRQRPVVSALLKWIALAARPLTKLELTKAIKYHLKTSYSKRMLKKTISTCGILINVRKTERQTHITLGGGLRELLFDDQSALRSDKKLAAFTCERADAHSQLANACVAYMQESPNLENVHRIRLKGDGKLKAAEAAFIKKHPFLEYAMVHWTTHARLGSFQTTKYANIFFDKKSPRRENWWKSYWISQRQSLAWEWTTPGNFSLLHLAAFFGIVPLALHVEGEGKLHKLIDSEDDTGKTPIQWATENSQPAMVKFLLQRGQFDEEALRQAARTGETTVLRMLLENRDTALRSPQVASPKMSSSGPPSPFQAMRKATLRSVSDFAKRLDQVQVEQTSPAVAADGYGKLKSETPLHIASKCGHVESVQILLAAGDDYHRTTDGGWTALHCAAWFGRPEIVDCLAAAGSDVQAATKDKLTPLHCAVKNNKPTVVKRLLCKHMVDMEARDLYGLTPLHVACKAHNVPMLELLLDNNANIEGRTSQGWTPLMLACMDMSDVRFAVAQLLLRRGADVNAKYTHKHTESGGSIELRSIDLARTYKRDGVARLLESFGSTNSVPVTDEEVQAIMPEIQQEVYDVPEDPGDMLLALDGAESEELVAVDDLPSSVGSDEEAGDGSDDEFEANDELGEIRQPSVCVSDEGVALHSSSPPAAQGLGILANERDIADIDLESNQKAASHVTDCITDEAVPSTARPYNLMSDIEQPDTKKVGPESVFAEKPDENPPARVTAAASVKETESPADDVERLCMQTAGLENVLPRGSEKSPPVSGDDTIFFEEPASLEDLTEAQRSGSASSKSPGSFGSIISRFTPGKGRSFGSRDREAKAKKDSPMEPSQESPVIDAIDQGAVAKDDVDEMQDKGDSKSGAGVFGRLKVRRTFSSKS